MVSTRPVVLTLTCLKVPLWKPFSLSFCIQPENALHSHIGSNAHSVPQFLFDGRQSIFFEGEEGTYKDSLCTAVAEEWVLGEDCGPYNTAVMGGSLSLAA